MLILEVWDGERAVCFSRVICGLGGVVVVDVLLVDVVVMVGGVRI